MNATEVNFDAIVGPTHNYAGLAYGNVASARNRNSVSRPREAALEGLAKMRFVADLGVRQAVLPPPVRPSIATLRELGYAGTDADVLARVANEDPTLLATVSSASAMWAANAATISPGPDTADGRLHISPANLISQFHRSIEARETAAALRAIFPDESAFAHHAPLPPQARCADEGAANHMRLCAHHGDAGVEVFVYGRATATADGPKIYPARHTLEASAAIARRHSLTPDRCVLVRQNPDAIDAGVFHNDVAAVANENVLLCHTLAFADQPQAVDEIRRKFATVSDGHPLHVIEVAEDELTLADAVGTYLFNSQIVTLPDSTMALIAPAECQENPRARAVIDRILAAGTPITTAHFLTVRQSMRNGGGPACLRLRVVLNDAQLAKTHPGVFLDAALYDGLVNWVNRNYRTELRTDELADPGLLREARKASEELQELLGLRF